MEEGQIIMDDRLICLYMWIKNGENFVKKF